MTFRVSDGRLYFINTQNLNTLDSNLRSPMNVLNNTTQITSRRRDENSKAEGKIYPGFFVSLN